MKNPINIEKWLDHHRKLGITHFIIRLEDTPHLIPFFSTQNDVYLTIGSSNDNPDGVDKEYNPQIARQRLFVKKSIDFCLKKGIKWIAHIDADELIDIIDENVKDIQQILESEINSLDSIYNIIMDNYEIKYTDIKNSCFDLDLNNEQLINCKIDNKCVSYANGKSIGRISPNLKEHGVHRFTITKPENGKEFNSKKIRVLHFESCDFDNYILKFSNLSKKNKTYPFKFYNESIQVANSDECKNKSTSCRQKFKDIYIKYKLT